MDGLSRSRSGRSSFRIDLGPTARTAPPGPSPRRNPVKRFDPKTGSTLSHSASPADGPTTRSPPEPQCRLIVGWLIPGRPRASRRHQLCSPGRPRSAESPRHPPRLERHLGRIAQIAMGACPHRRAPWPEPRGADAPHPADRTRPRGQRLGVVTLAVGSIRSAMQLELIAHKSCLLGGLDCRRR